MRQSLADQLARGPLPLDEVIQYGMQIADALDKAHARGIVHRDLKPGKLMAVAVQAACSMFRKACGRMRRALTVGGSSWRCRSLLPPSRR